MLWVVPSGKNFSDMDVPYVVLVSRMKILSLSIYFGDSSVLSSTCSLFTSVDFSSVAQSCLTLYDPTDCSMPGLHVHHQLPEFTQTHVHWVGDAIQSSHHCHPLFLLPSIFPSIRVFSNESALHIRWPKFPFTVNE